MRKAIYIDPRLRDATRALERLGAGMRATRSRGRRAASSAGACRSDASRRRSEDFPRLRINMERGGKARPPSGVGRHQPTYRGIGSCAATLGRMARGSRRGDARASTCRPKRGYVEGSVRARSWRNGLGRGKLGRQRRCLTDEVQLRKASEEAAAGPTPSAPPIRGLEQRTQPETPGRLAVRE